MTLIDIDATNGYQEMPGPSSPPPGLSGTSRPLAKMRGVVTQIDPMSDLVIVHKISEAFIIETTSPLFEGKPELSLGQWIRFSKNEDGKVVDYEPIAEQLVTVVNEANEVWLKTTAAYPPQDCEQLAYPTKVWSPDFEWLANFLSVDSFQVNKLQPKPDLMYSVYVRRNRQNCATIMEGGDDVVLTWELAYICEEADFERQSAILQAPWREGLPQRSVMPMQPSASNYQPSGTLVTNKKGQVNKYQTYAGVVCYSNIRHDSGRSSPLSDDEDRPFRSRGFNKNFGRQNQGVFVWSYGTGMAFLSVPDALNLAIGDWIKFNVRRLTKQQKFLRNNASCTVASFETMKPLLETRVLSSTIKVRTTLLFPRPPVQKVPMIGHSEQLGPVLIDPNRVRRAEKLMKETIRYGMKYEIWALKVRPLFEGNRIHWNFINFCYDDKESDKGSTSSSIAKPVDNDELCDLYGIITHVSGNGAFFYCRAIGNCRIHLNPGDEKRLKIGTWICFTAYPFSGQPQRPKKQQYQDQQYRVSEYDIVPDIMLTVVKGTFVWVQTVIRWSSPAYSNREMIIGESHEMGMIADARSKLMGSGKGKGIAVGDEPEMNRSRVWAVKCDPKKTGGHDWIIVEVIEHLLSEEDEFSGGDGESADPFSLEYLQEMDQRRNGDGFRRNRRGCYMDQEGNSNSDDEDDDNDEQSESQWDRQSTAASTIRSNFGFTNRKSSASTVNGGEISDNVDETASEISSRPSRIFEPMHGVLDENARSDVHIGVVLRKFTEAHYAHIYSPAMGLVYLRTTNALAPIDLPVGTWLEFTTFFWSDPEHLCQTQVTSYRMIDPIMPTRVIKDQLEIEAVIEFKGEVMGEFAIAEDLSGQLGRVVEDKAYVTRSCRNRSYRVWLTYRGRPGDEQAEWRISENVGNWEPIPRSVQEDAKIGDRLLKKMMQSPGFRVTCAQADPVCLKLVKTYLDGLS